MSDLPDPSLWRLLEHIGPWVGNLGGLIAGFIARPATESDER